MPHRLKLKLWTTTQREREEDRDRLGFSFPGGCDIMLCYRPEEVRRMERGSGHNDKLDQMCIRDRVRTWMNSWS